MARNTTKNTPRTAQERLFRVSWGKTPPPPPETVRVKRILPPPNRREFPRVREQSPLPYRPKKYIDLNKLEASVCRESFEDFVKRFWDTVIPEPLRWNWHMEAICVGLQEAAERLFRGEPKEADIVFNVPPGTSKSSIASILFPPWVWTRMPSARVICASYSHDLALDLSRKSRQVVKSDKYRRLFPEIQISEDQDAKGYFTNSAGGSRYCVGTGGSVTGFHGHFLIVDDPLDPNAAGRLTGADLKAANRWVTETLPSRKIDKKVSVTFLIMQRLHQEDPSAVMLERRNKGIPVRHFKFPAEISGTGYDQVSPRKYASKYREGLLDPERLPGKVLEEYRLSMGPFGYSGQFLQSPVPPGGGMFKVDRIKIQPAPADVEFTDPRDPRGIPRIIRYWDKAGTAGGGAHSVGLKLGQDRAKRFWLLDVQRGQWDSSTRELNIKTTAGLDGRKVTVMVEQEPGSGGKESAENTVKNLAGYRVRVDRVTGDKVTRADPFSVQVNYGNVYMVPAPWNAEFLNELRYFPFSKWKDQVDAASGAFAGLTRPKTLIGGIGVRDKGR